MNKAYQITDPNGLYFVTFTIVDWVDVFTRAAYRDTIIENLNFYHNQRGLRTYGYVVMTNHVHAILQQPEGNLSATIRDFKKMTARQIINLAKTEPESRRDWMLHRFEWNAAKRANVSDHQVWIHNSHSEEILKYWFFQQKLDYIHMNPVRAGWVNKPEDWRYSSASDLLLPTPMVPIYNWD